MPNASSTPDVPTQRLQELKKLSDGYQDSEKVLAFLIKAEKPKKTVIGVEPVVFTRGNSIGQEFKSEHKTFFTSQLEEACRNNEAFLVITPEFSLYTKPSNGEALTFNERGDIVSGQQNVTEVVNHTILMAKKYNKTIVLSSFCEQKRLKNGTSVFFNTTIVILPTGEKVFRRKTSEVYKVENQQVLDISQKVLSRVNGSLQETNEELEEIIDLTYNSLKPIIVSDNKGKKHIMGVLVCQERAVKQIYEKLSLDTDMVIITISEGSLDLNNDSAAVAAYGESTFARDMMSERFNGKQVMIAITNERTNKASVLEFDGNEEITGILLK